MVLVIRQGMTCGTFAMVRNAPWDTHREQASTIGRATK